MRFEKLFLIFLIVLSNCGNDKKIDEAKYSSQIRFAYPDIPEEYPVITKQSEAEGLLNGYIFINPSTSFSGEAWTRTAQCNQITSFFQMTEKDLCNRCVVPPLLENDCHTAGVFYRTGGSNGNCQCEIGYYFKWNLFAFIDNHCVKEDQRISKCEEYQNPLTKRACGECDKIGYEWDFDTMKCMRHNNQLRYSSECDELYKDKWLYRTDVDTHTNYDKCNNCVKGHGFWHFGETLADNFCECGSRWENSGDSCKREGDFVVTLFAERNLNQVDRNYVKPLDYIEKVEVSNFANNEQCTTFYNPQWYNKVNPLDNMNKCGECITTGGTWNPESNSCICAAPAINETIINWKCYIPNTPLPAATATPVVQPTAATEIPSEIDSAETCNTVYHPVYHPIKNLNCKACVNSYGLWKTGDNSSCICGDNRKIQINYCVDDLNETEQTEETDTVENGNGNTSLNVELKILESEGEEGDLTGVFGR